MCPSRANQRYHRCIFAIFLLLLLLVLGPFVSNVPPRGPADAPCVPSLQTRERLRVKVPSFVAVRQHCDYPRLFL